MPTKLNRAGNQPNYIEAGHGDASGEYAEHGTGGNVHYKVDNEETSTSKTGVQITEKPKTDQGAENSKGLNNENSSNLKSKEKVTNYIISHSNMNKKSLGLITKDIEMGSDEANEILSKAYEKHNYKFSVGKSSYFVAGGEGSMTLATKDIESAYRSPGETFWHESGHLIDYSNTQFAFGSSRAGQTLSVAYRSEKYNKTLFETVAEEGQKFTDSYDAYDEIQEEKNKIQQKYLNETGYNEQEKDNLIAQRDAISEEIKNDKRYIEAIENREEKRKLYYENPFSEKAYKELNDAVANVSNVYNIISKEKIGFEEINNKIDKISDDFFNAKAKASKEFTKKYASLSDMMDAATNGRKNLNCGSHGKKYWRQSQYAQTHEFFAEVFSAYARQNKEELDVIKKYYPKSVEIVEEIIKRYK